MVSAENIHCENNNCKFNDRVPLVLHPELYGILFLIKIWTILVIKEDHKIIIFVKWLYFPHFSFATKWLRRKKPLANIEGQKLTFEGVQGVVQD